MEYLILIVPLIIMLMEFFLELKDNARSGIRKITFAGWIVVFLTAFLMGAMWFAIKQGNEDKKELNSLITGGDSYPIAVFNTKQCDCQHLSFDIFNIGSYPLKEVDVNLIDVDAFNTGISKKDTSIVNKWNLFKRYENTITSGGGLMITATVCYQSPEMDRNFILNINTLYAKFKQFVKLRQKNGGFSIATRVMRYDTKKGVFDSFVKDSINADFFNPGETKENLAWADFYFNN